MAGGLATTTVWSQDSKDTPTRGRKYTPPPDTARVSVRVIKETNGKPIQNAAVIFHIMEGTEKNKGNMELKSNEEGNAVIEVIPIGKTVRLQVIANGFQTFGDDYKITADTKEIVVKMKRPGRQYSTYEHAGDVKPGDQPAPAPPDAGSAPK